MSKWFYDLVVRLWPLGRLVNRAGTLPGIGRLLRPLFSPRENQAIIIPVHQAVRGTESLVLPYTLLPTLIERAGHRFIMGHCMCRQGQGCRNYPQDIGCIFLGGGAREIDPALGRPADVAEALAHARLAMEAGLVPLIVHASFDAFILGVPYRRMLAICFCCDCCCTVRQTLREGPTAFWEAVVRLPGLRVVVTEACTGCGACVELCHVRAISRQDGHAVIGEQCKGCGRCATACPSGAIRLHLDENVDVMGRFLALVEKRTEIG